MSAGTWARSGLVAVLMAGAAQLEAQRPAADLAGTTLPQAVSRVGDAWSGGDLRALRGMLAAGGVRLRDPVGDHGLLEPRKAAAALRELWSGHGSGRVALERSSLAGGTPPRAFAHFRWRTVPRGTSEPLDYTLFVGMVHGAEGWRIYEIRVLR